MEENKIHMSYIYHNSNLYHKECKLIRHTKLQTFLTKGEIFFFLYVDDSAIIFIIKMLSKVQICFHSDENIMFAYARWKRQYTI